jgi:hypothetical protein
VPARTGERQRSTRGHRSGRWPVTVSGTVARVQRILGSGGVNYFGPKRRTCGRRRSPAKLGNAQLITNTGPYHSACFTGAPCVQTKANAYLFNGTLPGTTTCKSAELESGCCTVRPCLATANATTLTPAD